MRTVNIEVKELREGFWTITVDGYSHGWASSLGEALSRLTEDAADIESEAT